MSQEKSKRALINWDLVTVNPYNKNWDWKDLFCYWGVNIQSIIGFSLITSLYLIYDLNTFVVLIGTIIGSFFVYLLCNLLGKPSQKFGLPFVVLLRSSLGFKGARYFGLLRSIVGIFMFGIQTYFISKAFGYLIRIFIFNFEPSLLDKEIFLIFFLGLNLIDWFSIVVAIGIQTILFSVGMIFNKKLIRFSALAVYSGMVLFFFITLLSDVKFTSTTFKEALDLSNFLDTKNFGPIVTIAGTIFAYFSIVILTFGDFSRYVKSENELKKGNFGLILNLVIFSFFALFIVVSADSYLKLNPDNIGTTYTNPTDIIGKLDNLLITNLVLIFIIIASASTNLIANFIPAQYTLINFMPSSLNLKKSGFIIAFLGFLIGIFWLTYFSQIGILSFIDTFGCFFGPLFGLMICDFYLIKNENLINKDIYSIENSGNYYYSKGWHIKGVYSIFIGFIFSASTIWNSDLMFLQSYSWIIGAFMSGFLYYLLAKE